MGVLGLINPKRLLYAIKRQAFKNYDLTRRWKYFQFWLVHKNIKNPLIIYQMGKVGSSTLAKSLRESSASNQIFQVHFLTKDFIERVDKQYREASKVRKRPIVDQHFLESMYLGARILRGNAPAKWKVISIVRDPIARNISSFFQAFSIYFAKEYLAMQSDELTQREQVKRLIELFINNFERHNVPLEWFDIHMKPVFNIDVYQQEFQKSRGYTIYNVEKVDLLLLRLEDLNKCAKEAFHKFLGTENFKLVNANISRDKDYSKNYSLFKNQLRLPPSYISSMYNSKFMRHFYTDEEINCFKAKWSS